MGPFNYNMANPGDAILGGLRVGAGLQEVQLAQEDRAAKLAKEQAAQQAALAQQADLQTLWSNPNAGHREYAAVMTKHPALAENLTKSFKVLDEGQKQNALNLGSRVYSLLLAGKNDEAVAMLREREAADPAGKQEWGMLAEMVTQSPQTAKMMGALHLAGLLGPDKFAAAFPALQGEQRAAEKAPAELKKAEADAASAVADATIKGEQAKVAPQTVLLDLEKKGWDIKKIKEDIEISKQSNRIAAMNAATSREGNNLKREELRLKVAEAQEKLDSKVRERVATAEAGAANIDNMLNTVERIKGNKSLNDVVGAIEGRLPALVDDEQADAVALIETLGSQAFLAQIPNIKGMGALSNAEGEKLQAALQNLSRTQSEKQFRANLDEASRLLKKGRENLSRSTGVPLSKPDTPAAPGSRPPLSSFQGK